jgi:hypothetical protein
MPTSPTGAEGEARRSLGPRHVGRPRRGARRRPRARHPAHAGRGRGGAGADTPSHRLGSTSDHGRATGRTPVRPPALSRGLAYRGLGRPGVRRDPGDPSSLTTHSRIAGGAPSSPRATAGRWLSIISWVTRPHSIAPPSSTRRVKKACVSSSAIPSRWSTQPSRVTLMPKVRSPMRRDDAVRSVRARGSSAAFPSRRHSCRGPAGSGVAAAVASKPPR